LYRDRIGKKFISVGPTLVQEATFSFQQGRYGHNNHLHHKITHHSQPSPPSVTTTTTQILAPGPPPPPSTTAQHYHHSLTTTTTTTAAAATTTATHSLTTTTTTTTTMATACNTNHRFSTQVDPWRAAGIPFIKVAAGEKPPASIEIHENLMGAHHLGAFNVLLCSTVVP
jgi:hypothetical protein